MSKIVTMQESEAPEPIPEGVYKAMVKEVEEQTGDYGDYFRFVFEITEGQYKETTRSLIASKKLSRTKSGKSSKLVGIVKALTGTEPKAGDNFDVDSLTNKKCQIFVENGPEKDGIVYQTISKVMPF